jgi:hypothetical protein
VDAQFLSGNLKRKPIGGNMHENWGKVSSKEMGSENLVWLCLS